MDSPNPPSMRVLIRPANSTQPTLSPLSSATLSPPIPPPPQPNPPPPPPLQNGIVVVGFIGRRSGDVTQLINRGPRRQCVWFG
ncbi:hypothetical protein Acr_23g0012230 [Actinidia rufa]|uniref:Uncharacterized protein n=1 Tax=Actinidia rufa TaxID=165716 RepID=A0A7J0GQ12_9ERIC|nr:hypothetical protein Acr_23g0012230 [Actinidia rufa]